MRIIKNGTVKKPEPTSLIEHEVTCHKCGCVYSAKESEAEGGAMDRFGGLTFACPEEGCENYSFVAPILGKFRQIH